ncbi:hypothetical protein JJ685_00715 [Ramlibacter monticola]|uniref:Uncharacterized protein n=2 Tax=Ramlibacter monticola TaxID=1926872 RepID=A0A936YTX4_9BURK|nr:hypothetical protein [Ramlibacter monticola]
MRRPALVLVLAMLALAGCRDRATNPTAVLGGPAPAASRAATPAEADAGIPMPAVPPGTQPRLARSGVDTALAVWTQDGHVVAATYTPPAGWGPATPLEQIYGEASEPQLASNGQGVAMAVWRHTVGSIQSLRFSRYEAATGWSPPDVLPGALPRPPAAGHEDAVQLSMDAAGEVSARWASGFDAREVQTARFVPGQGWSRALSEPLAAGPGAAPASGPH